MEGSDERIDLVPLYLQKDDWEKGGKFVEASERLLKFKIEIKSQISKKEIFCSKRFQRLLVLTKMRSLQLL